MNKSRLFIDTQTALPESFGFKIGREYNISKNGFTQPFCVYCGETETGHLFYQQATSGGVFDIPKSSTTTYEILPSPNVSYHSFRSSKGIVIEARNHATALAFSKTFDKGDNVEYLPTNTDLLYLH